MRDITPKIHLADWLHFAMQQCKYGNYGNGSKETHTVKLCLQELEKYGLELFIDPSTITWTLIKSPNSSTSFLPCITIEYSSEGGKSVNGKGRNLDAGVPH